MSRDYDGWVLIPIVSDGARAETADVAAKVKTADVVYVDGEATALQLGNIRAANVVLLGALSALMERGGLAGAELSASIWLDVITSRVPPKYVELNRQAFNAGREAVLKI